MKKCDEEQTLCSQPTTSRLPTRVIDVGLDASSDTVHLKETTASDQGQYMSLSHCWGKEQIITTTTSTLSDRKAGIKLPELSKTFRHAVTITRGLGIRYLWIDSLCIIQDSRQDWEIESAQMASIYTNSLLNLAATHSSNGKGGCFAERCALHVAHDQFTRTMDYENTMEHTSPLLSRGWVFQERLLARRTLHFHAKELVWECASGLSCECSRLEGHRWGDPDGLLQVVAGSRESKLEQLKMMYTSILSPTATEAKILDVWLELVTEYCSLKLTKQMDRLPALSGLATRVASRLSSEYLAGVWSQDL
ncbi:HET-domain-containing protein, partial [Acephala macrosclerotiorum]